MLLKVFKYFFKRIMKILFPIIIASIALSLLLGVTIRFSAIFCLDEEFSPYGGGVLISFLATMIFALYAVFIIGVFIIFSTFGKDMTSDEAYLTYTLPVSAKNHILGRVLASIAVLAIESLAIYICVLMIVYIGGSTMIKVEDFYSVISEIITNYGYLNFGNYQTLYIIEKVILLIFQIVAMIEFIFFIILFKSQVVKKYQFLITFGIIFLASSIYSVLSSISSVMIRQIFDEKIFDGTISLLSYQPIMIINFLIYIGFCFLFYFLCKLLVSKNINLS